MKRQSRFSRIGLVLLALLFTASAQASRADGNPAATEQRLRAGLQQMLVDLASKGELVDASGVPMQFDISEPSRDVDNLGVVIDSRDSGDKGLVVMAVTPGSAAAKMGVQGGDRLVAVNRQSLTDLGRDANDRPRAVDVLRTAVGSVGDGGRLALSVDRDGRRIDFEGTLQRLRLPAMKLSLSDGVQVASNAPTNVTAGCGRISDFDVAPRQQNLHRAQLISIDGNSVGPSGSPSFRLSTGPHTLEVAEEIDSRYLSFNSRFRNSGSDRHKQIDVDVKSDTTYFLAARLIPDKRSEWRDGAYWEPALWLEKNERCSP
ncbi:MAG: PDZ domain-containing protein [Dokdonella sp.]